jgi:multidrug efflux pump subunit AcrA (membrane-fusion protein)
VSQSKKLREWTVCWGVFVGQLGLPMKKVKPLRPQTHSDRHRDQPQNGQPGPKKISAKGSLAAWQEAIIGAEVNGLKITDVRVNVGDRVQRGDVLAVLQSDTLRAELAQAEAALAEATADLMALFKLGTRTPIRAGMKNMTNNKPPLSFFCQWAVLGGLTAIRGVRWVERCN